MSTPMAFGAPRIGAALFFGGIIVVGVVILCLVDARWLRVIGYVVLGLGILTTIITHSWRVLLWPLFGWMERKKDFGKWDEGYMGSGQEPQKKKEEGK
jgi:hypothetical protein